MTSRTPLCLFFFCCLLLGSTTSSSECNDLDEAPRYILCYVNNVTFSQVDVCRCSHVIVPFVDQISHNNGNLTLDQDTRDFLQDIAARSGGRLHRILSLVLHNEEIDSLPSAEIIARIEQLIDDSLVDGIEIDWQQPSIGDHSKKNRANFVQFIKSMHAAMQEKLIVTTNLDHGNTTVVDEEINATRPLILLRLPTLPESLVKSFDLKPLTKTVDLFVINTHNITDPLTGKATYHHSRLMGLSDIQNTDSILDLAISLGIPADRLVAGVPTFASQFRLADVSRNTPGSLVTEGPIYISSGQVCLRMSEGNWTVERDDDLTGTYAYSDSGEWIAFDDQLAAQIKAKYFLLRDIAGVALMTVDMDDFLIRCSFEQEAAVPLVRTYYNNFFFPDSGERTRRHLIESLEKDLSSSASVLANPVYPSNRIRASPFRIVRIVDRSGETTVLRQAQETSLRCSRQGYYRHPEDCSRFYRCVKFDQYVDDFTVFEYDCPYGLVFDEKWEVCTWPSQAAPCGGSSEIQPVPTSKFTCPGEGYFADPENCRWFFACRDYTRDGTTFTQYEFRCPFGLVFDAQNLLCNWPWLVPNCSSGRNIETSETTTERYERQKPVSIGSPGYLAGKLVTGEGLYKDPRPAHHSELIVSPDCVDCASPTLKLNHPTSAPYSATKPQQQPVSIPAQTVVGGSNPIRVVTATPQYPPINHYPTSKPYASNAYGHSTDQHNPSAINGEVRNLHAPIHTNTQGAWGGSSGSLGQSEPYRPVYSSYNNGPVVHGPPASKAHYGGDTYTHSQETYSGPAVSYSHANIPMDSGPEAYEAHHPVSKNSPEPSTGGYREVKYTDPSQTETNKQPLHSYAPYPYSHSDGPRGGSESQSKGFGHAESTGPQYSAAISTEQSPQPYSKPPVSYTQTKGNFDESGYGYDALPRTYPPYIEEPSSEKSTVDNYNKQKNLAESYPRPIPTIYSHAEEAVGEREPYESRYPAHDKSKPQVSYKQQPSNADYEQEKHKIVNPYSQTTVIPPPVPYPHHERSETNTPSKYITSVEDPKAPYSVGVSPYPAGSYHPPIVPSDGSPSRVSTAGYKSQQSTGYDSTAQAAIKSHIPQGLSHGRDDGPSIKPSSSGPLEDHTIPPCVVAYHAALAESKRGSLGQSALLPVNNYQSKSPATAPYVHQEGSAKVSDSFEIQSPTKPQVAVYYKTPEQLTAHDKSDEEVAVFYQVSPQPPSSASKESRENPSSKPIVDSSNGYKQSVRGKDVRTHSSYDNLSYSAPTASSSSSGSSDPRTLAYQGAASGTSDANTQDPSSRSGSKTEKYRKDQKEYNYGTAQHSGPEPTRHPEQIAPYLTQTTSEDKYYGTSVEEDKAGGVGGHRGVGGNRRTGYNNPNRNSNRHGPSRNEPKGLRQGALPSDSEDNIQPGEISSKGSAAYGDKIVIVKVPSALKPALLEKWSHTPLVSASPSYPSATHDAKALAAANIPTDTYSISNNSKNRNARIKGKTPTSSGDASKSQSASGDYATADKSKPQPLSELQPKFNNYTSNKEHAPKSKYPGATTDSSSKTATEPSAGYGQRYLQKLYNDKAGNGTLGPEVCVRAGLFRHPADCQKFYECYWDRWINQFTVHIFKCPVQLVYDEYITACNWPFDGPACVPHETIKLYSQPETK